MYAYIYMLYIYIYVCVCVCVCVCVLKALLTPLKNIDDKFRTQDISESI